MRRRYLEKGKAESGRKSDEYVTLNAVDEKKNSVNYSHACTQS